MLILMLCAARQKVIDNPHARWVGKGGHKEKNFLLSDAAFPSIRYRIFVRVSATRSSVFSVGLIRVYAPDENLVLLRYNGGYHAHGNIIEKNKVPAVCHKHIATERYIKARLDPAGYAEPITDYNSVEGAFDCLCRDCGVPPLKPDSSQPKLDL